MSNFCDFLPCKNNSVNNNNNNLKLCTFMSFNELDNYIKIFSNELEMLEYTFLNQSNYVNEIDQKLLHNENNLINLLNIYDNIKTYINIVEYSICYLNDELMNLSEIVNQLEAIGVVFSCERCCYRERFNMYELLFKSEKHLSKTNADIGEFQKNIALYKKYFNEEYPIISVASKHLDLLLNLENHLNVIQYKLLENEKKIMKLHFENNLNAEKQKL